MSCTLAKRTQNNQCFQRCVDPFSRPSSFPVREVGGRSGCHRPHNDPLGVSIQSAQASGSAQCCIASHLNRSAPDFRWCRQQSTVMLAPPLPIPCPAASLFHTATGIAFADLAIDGHRETWPIRSTRFRSWLRRCYCQQAFRPC